MSSNQKTAGQGLCQKRRLRDKAAAPLIGYMRVSKADGSQVLDLQKDALLAAGVNERHLYSDRASGKQDDRPGLLRAYRRLERAIRWSCGSLIVLAGASGTSSTSCMTLLVGALASRCSPVKVLQSTQPRLRASSSSGFSRR